jgi:HAD superfamily hydrolase (TIGR01549 family)
MPTVRPTWIFFDLGCTLVDENDAQNARLHELSRLLALQGLSHSAEALRRRLEHASASFARFPFLTLLAELGLPADVVAELRRSARYDHARERVYPGVPALLEQLSARYQVGLIANQSLGSEQRMRGYGIVRAFAVVAASAELGTQKPDPAIFEWALRRAGCAAVDALMVGDRIDNDVVPARRLGMRTVHVLQGLGRFHTPRSLDETPDHTIGSITDLAALMDRLEREPSG